MTTSKIGWCSPKMIHRRTILKSAAAVTLAAPFIRPAAAQQRSITVRDLGGPYDPAYKEAFYDPFLKETGIEVVGIKAAHSPTGEIKAMVDAENYLWDGAMMSESDVNILAADNYLEPVAGGGLGPNAAEIPPTFRTDYVMGVGAYATVLAYRTDTMGDNPPKSWADFWEGERIPGRRALRKTAIDTLEEALMADGVARSDLYPIDVDRAFKSLDRIKPSIDIWWTGGAQTSQLLSSGEVDLLPTWNGRAQAAIDGGAPVKLVWDGALYSYSGWCILRGTPKADLMREFIEFCSDAKRQAIVPNYAADGPANPRAYEYIDPARGALLPTNPKFLPNMVASDSNWWAQNRARLEERFAAWVLT